jgi:hypothetical protein
MGIKRHHQEEIVTKLRQVEFLVRRILMRSGKFKSRNRPFIVGANNTV